MPLSCEGVIFRSAKIAPCRCRPHDGDRRKLRVCPLDTLEAIPSELWGPISIDCRDHDGSLQLACTIRDASMGHAHACLRGCMCTSSCELSNKCLQLGGVTDHLLRKQHEHVLASEKLKLYLINSQPSQQQIQAADNQYVDAEY